MFNSGLKKEALEIHKKTAERYNKSRDKVQVKCEELYALRKEVVEVINFIEQIISSIANSPKEFEIKMGKVSIELKTFKDTENYAIEAYNSSVKAGAGIAGGVMAGAAVASMAPTALMGVATTFGTASTGTAISALSGAAAQKAALAWIGRTFMGTAVKGAGMAAGKAFLTLAGPIGWGITGISIGSSLLSLSSDNKAVADMAIEEAKEYAKAREGLDESVKRIESLFEKIMLLVNDLNSQMESISKYRNVSYNSLEDKDKLYLGTLVNNTLSLSELLNQNIE